MKELPKIFWLFMVFSPIVIMLLLFGNGNESSQNQTPIAIAVFGVNPVLSLVGSYGLFWKEDAKVSAIVPAILLGVCLAVLNVVIAAFTACAMNPPKF